MSNMVEGELLMELTQRVARERERRLRLVERFQSDIEESLAEEVQLQARINLIPGSRLTASSPDVIKDFRGAPAILMELLAAAGPEGMIGAELNARLRERDISQNTIEQAKQRLKRDRKLIDYDGKVWRLKQYVASETAPEGAAPTKGGGRKRAPASA